MCRTGNLQDVLKLLFWPWSHGPRRSPQPQAFPSRDDLKGDLIGGSSHFVHFDAGLCWQPLRPLSISQDGWTHTWFKLTLQTIWGFLADTQCMHMYAKCQMPTTQIYLYAHVYGYTTYPVSYNMGCAWMCLHFAYFPAGEGPQIEKSPQGSTP